jgi:hypothetical protein
MQSIDMLVETTREFLQQIAALLPRLALALAVLFVGWLAAKTVRFAVERALRAVNFHVLTERAGTDNFLAAGRNARRHDHAIRTVGLLASHACGASIIAFNGPGLSPTSQICCSALECCFRQKSLSSMLVVIFGSYFARFVGSAVHAPIALDAQGCLMPIC